MGRGGGGVKTEGRRRGEVEMIGGEGSREDEGKLDATEREQRGREIKREGNQDSVTVWAEA